jgi:hypothetical protein
VGALGAVAASAAAHPMETVVVSTPVIEVLDSTGAIQRPAVEQAVAAVTDELRRCHAAGWSSDALAWIVVDWHGKVTKLELAVTKPEAEKCLTKVLKQLVVTTAQGRATIVLRLAVDHELVTELTELDTQPGATPVPRAKPSVELSRIGVGTEFADPERIRTIVRRHADTLRTCYALGLDAGAPATNRVTLKLAVDAAGVVFGATVLAAASPREMVDCFKRELARLNFPQPAKPTTVEIEQRPTP